MLLHVSVVRHSNIRWRYLETYSKHTQRVASLEMTKYFYLVAKDNYGNYTEYLVSYVCKNPLQYPMYIGVSGKSTTFCVKKDNAINKLEEN